MIFFVLRVFMKSRLWGETFETWDPEMEEPMLNCKNFEFLDSFGFFPEFEVGGWRSNVRDRWPNVRLQSTCLGGWEEQMTVAEPLPIFVF